MQRDNGGDSFREFPPRGASSFPALARLRPGIFFALRFALQRPLFCRFSQRGVHGVVAALVLAASASVSALANPLAYEPNEGSGTIIDTATDAVIERGDFTNRVVMQAAGKRVYVSNGKSGSVSVIDTSTNRAVASVPTARVWSRLFLQR